LRPDFIDLLSCPTCGHDLRLEPSARGGLAEDGHVLEGGLACDVCGTSFPIERGVPRLLPSDKNRSPTRENTAARFGFEWNEFSKFDLAEEEKSMATWFRPKELDELRGRTVFDAGCGMGRHATIADRHGVARLVGVDLGSAVEAAFTTTRQLKTVCIVQGDIYHPPLKAAAFDAGYSIGVLHHLPDPKRGFAALAPKVRPGGWFQAWVYGREGNGWLLYILNPVRRLTSKMPLTLLKLLSRLVAVPVALASKTIYRLPGVGPRLPYGDYMRWMSSGSFSKIHAIVFDQLLAPVAYYMRRSEVLDMVAVDGWTVQGIEHSRGMSWGVAVERRGERTSDSGARYQFQNS
jgi:uncharacterized protein YbaR (Trm112 family)/ubiquinone/menaquinone biosynthesis C-methylase UbiE